MLAVDMDRFIIRRTSLFKCIIAATLVGISRSQDFSPNVQTKCIDGRMLATVRTTGPFRGIMYASDRQSECRALGTGSKETLIDIPLTDFDRCNVHYDPATEEYSVTLNVHEHPIIILQQDRVFNLSCSRSSPEPNNNININPFNTINEPRQLQMGVYRQDAKIHHVLFGNSYTVRIESNGLEDFTVATCFGFAGQNDSLRLTDANGCSTDMALISNFVYDPIAHVAHATLFSMFKFPQHDMIHLQCSVEICNGACPRTDCDRRRDDPFPSNRNPFPVKQKRRRFTSTTIRVSEIGIPPEKLTDAQEVAIRATCGQHYQLLSAMCILFGCVFLVSIFVNFLFCCLAGYCCCSNNGSKHSDRISSSPLEYVDPATFDQILVHRNAPDNSSYRYPGISYIESPSRNSAASKGSMQHQGGVHLAHKRVGSCTLNQQSPGSGSAGSANSSSSDKPLVLVKKRGARVHPQQQELSQYLATDDLPPPPKSFLASPTRSSSHALPL